MGRKSHTWAPLRNWFDKFVEIKILPRGRGDSSHPGTHQLSFRSWSAVKETVLGDLLLLFPHQAASLDLFRLVSTHLASPVEPRKVVSCWRNFPRNVQLFWHLGNTESTGQDVTDGCNREQRQKQAGADTKGNRIKWSGRLERFEAARIFPEKKEQRS